MKAMKEEDKTAEASKTSTVADSTVADATTPATPATDSAPDKKP
jgi:hypothetical protein